MRSILRLLTVCTCVLAAVIAGVGAQALGAQQSGTLGSGDIPAKPTTSSLDPSDDPRLAIAPAWFPTVDAEPGTTIQLALDARNHTEEPLSLRSIVLPLRGSTDPDSFVTPAERDSRAAEAVEWVEMPFARWPRLAPNTQLRFPVTVRVPDDARPGAYALGLGVQQRVSAPGLGGVESNEARVVAAASPVSRLVIRVPGDATSELRLRDVESPRLVWGGDPATFDATVVNSGDTLLDVDGEVQLGSFVGTASRDLSTDSRELLPEGERTLSMRWSDPPLLGWFEPRLVVVGGEGSGVRVERTLPTVWVLPPWWLLLALAVAIWLPVRSIRRRRRARRRR